MTFSSFMEQFSFKITTLTAEYLVLELRPSGTLVLLAIPTAQRQNQAAVLHVEVILEDWVRPLPSVIRLLEDPGDQVCLVRPNEEVRNVTSTRVGKLRGPLGTIPWQFSFQAAQLADRRVRLQITLWGPKVLVQYTHFAEGVKIGGTCSLGVNLPELPQLRHQLEQMGVRYEIKSS